MTAISARHLQGRKVVSSIGMIVLLISFSMMFATLFLGFMAFRLTSDVWPPMGMQRVDLFFPTLSSIVIALSSASYFLFEKYFNENKKDLMRVGLALTFVFGLGFMFTQYKLWSVMAASGLYVSGGIFPSLLYSLTWIHVAHIVLALISLLSIVPVCFRGYSDDRVTWVSNAGKFWHFLGLVWFIMYIMMFIF